MAKRSIMTVEELKQLYPAIGLMDGYDGAIVGIVPSPDNSCVAVYDSMKIISMLGDRGFKSQQELIDHFNNMVASAQKNSKIGPLFMQMVSIKPEYDDMADWIEAEDDRPILDYEEDFDPNHEDKPFPDYEEEDEDDSSDSDIEYLDDSDSDSDSDSGEYIEEEVLEDYDEDPDAPYMEITVDIGTNDPRECQIVRSAEKIKEAIGLIFPNLPRLDMISKAKFYLRNLEDMD